MNMADMVRMHIGMGIDIATKEEVNAARFIMVGPYKTKPAGWSVQAAGATEFGCRRV